MKRYALLVGVDHYINDKSRKSDDGDVVSLSDLRGCVNDANSFKALVHDKFKFDYTRILLSPLPGADSPPHDALPTYANLKKEFVAIESMVKDGDLFFFHFSGHGAPLKTTSKSPAGREKDPSLMTADFCCGKPALRGWQLNSWLKKLNAKNAQVVVSLDSCHSGGAWRGSAVAFRTPENWPSVPNLAADEEAVQDEGDLQPAFRDAVLETSWSLNPEAFTLMTACEDHQLAAEKSYHGKHGGAYTNELLDYLKDCDYHVSYRMARDYLQGQLGKEQRPTCFGRDRLYFLGNTEPFTATPLEVRLDGNTLHINAGKAHGICKGSEFTPFYSASTQTITVDGVEEFKSTARVRDEIKETLSAHKSKAIIPLRWCLGAGKTLRVFVDPHLGKDFKDALLKSLKSRIVNHVHMVEEDSHDFKVLKEGHEVKIVGPKAVVGHTEPVQALNLRGIATGASAEASAAEAAAPLVHLARFAHVHDLRPEHMGDSPQFTVSLTPVSHAEEPYPAGELLQYQFDNNSDQDLRFAVINLTPEFKIQQLYPANDSQVLVNRNGTKRFKFRVNLPTKLPHEVRDRIRRHGRRDIIRTLVSTSEGFSWKSLELSHIWEAGKVDLPKLHPERRDAEIESEEEWWLKDIPVTTTDTKYTSPHPMTDPKHTIPHVKTGSEHAAPHYTKGSEHTAPHGTKDSQQTTPHATTDREWTGTGNHEQSKRGTYPITGIPKDPETSTIPVRQDVDDWYREQTDHGNRIQLTLFTEALTAIQQRRLDDERSYFRLAGIHGAPWTEWDGNANKGTGFGVHDDYTFPTWNRVYVTLFEQVVYEAMIEFIDHATHVAHETKSEWKGEARRWRLPYWDFARFATHHDTHSDELRLPILATLPMVRVRVFGSASELVNKPNPLYRFQMPTPMGDLGRPYNITGQSVTENGQGVLVPFHKCLSTTKYGLLGGYSPDVWADGGQNWLRGNLALNEHPWYQNMDERDSVPNLQDMTYRLLKARLDNWGSFSSTRFSGKDSEPGNWMNLEAIHNSVHNWVGGFMFSRPVRDDLKLWGAGHMSSAAVAAFDPIFWLLHCNVDRLAAIWQSLNPRNWFDDEHSKKSQGNALRPFHRDTKGHVFKSDDVRDWRALNYEYAITKDQERLERDPERLYGQRTVDLYKRTLGDDRIDYILGIKYDRYALGGSPFQINIFFGDVSPKSFYDSRSKNFVGSVFSFSNNPKDSHQSNSTEQQRQGTMSVAQLPATLAVRHYEREYGQIPRLSYVVVDSQGRSVQIDFDVKLYRVHARFFDPSHRCVNDDYRRIAFGVRAQVDY